MAEGPSGILKTGASPASHRSSSEEEYARDRPAAITLQPISNAACKPQAKDAEMTIANFVRRSES
jgi:hypothetical protein